MQNRDREVVKELIAKAEINYKIPSGLLDAIAKVESGTRNYAVNIDLGGYAA